MIPTTKTEATFHFSYLSFLDMSWNLATKIEDIHLLVDNRDVERNNSQPRYYKYPVHPSQVLIQK